MSEASAKSLSKKKAGTKSKLKTTSDEQAAADANLASGSGLDDGLNTGLDGDLNQANVVNWLKQQPMLFCDHPELLDVMIIPHRTNSKATSLIERQVERLRDSLQQQESRLQNLLQIASENETLTQQIHDLALAVLATQDLTHATEALISGLHEDFNAEEVVVALRGQANAPERDQTDMPLDVQFYAEDDGFWQQHAEWFTEGRASVGRPCDISSTLFQSRDIGSQVCVPLMLNGQACGVLAIGSAHAERFPPGTSTDLLQRLAELISSKLSTLLAE